MSYSMPTSLHYFTCRNIIFLFLYLHCKKYRMRPTLKWEVSLHEDFKKSATSKTRGLNLPQNLDSIGLTWFQESNLFHLCRRNFYQTHTHSSLLLAFTMPLATYVTVYVIAQKITDITNVKPQWAKRFEVGSYTF